MYSGFGMSCWSALVPAWTDINVYILPDISSILADFVKATVLWALRFSNFSSTSPKAWLKALCDMYMLHMAQQLQHSGII